jgi:hypothetical protein
MSKFDEGDYLSFRCEKNQKLAFQTFCDDGGFNESAVLRMMLKRFLEEKGVDENDFKAK